MGPKWAPNKNGHPDGDYKSTNTNGIQMGPPVGTVMAPKMDPQMEPECPQICCSTEGLDGPQTMVTCILHALRGPNSISVYLSNLGVFL